MSAAVLLVWLGCAGITAWIAKEKGRSVVEGVILGILIGFIGIIVEICLPKKNTEKNDGSHSAS